MFSSLIGSTKFYKKKMLMRNAAHIKELEWIITFPARYNTFPNHDYVVLYLYWKEY